MKPMKLIGRQLIRVSALFAALCLAGCAARAPAEDYTVRIDPSLDADTASVVLGAMAQWQAATGVRMHAEVGACTDALYEACVRSGALPEGTIGLTAFAALGGTSSTLDIAQMARRGADVTQTAVHELGHAMGLVHTGAGTIMCAMYTCQASSITAADAAQWDRLQR